MPMLMDTDTTNHLQTLQPTSDTESDQEVAFTFFLEEGEGLHQLSDMYCVCQMITKPNSSTYFAIFHNTKSKDPSFVEKTF